MRELTKSMMSFSWAMSVYGLKQMFELACPRDMSRPFGPATDSFNAVTAAASNQLGSTLKSMYAAGDQMQRSAVDMTFRLFMLDSLGSTAMKMTSDMMQWSTRAVEQATRGCGACAPTGTTAGTGTGAGTGSGAGTGAQSGSGAGTGATTGGGQPPLGWGPMPFPPT
jgi:hypothetical protein